MGGKFSGGRNCSSSIALGFRVNGRITAPTVLKPINDHYLASRPCRTARRPTEHADTNRLKWSGAIQRREFVTRDPWRSNELQRCMPRWQAIESGTTRGGATGYERSEISGVRSREARWPARSRGEAEVAG